MGVGNSKSTTTILATIGILLIGAGVLFLLLKKGASVVVPIFTTPGPTNTMIQNTVTNSSLNDPNMMGNIHSFDIEGSNFKFEPSEIVVKQGDTVQINFKNNQGMHNLTIDGLNVATKTITEGASEQITFVAEKKGTYEFYCSMDNHRAVGMKGILVVQ